MVDLRLITDKQKLQYNKLVTHIIQSWEWGEFRKSLGLPLLRYGLYKSNKLIKAFQLTLHKIPYTNQFVGYLPKGPKPDKVLSESLLEIGKAHNCAFIKVEPDVIPANAGIQLTNQPKDSLLDPRFRGDDAQKIDSNFIPSPKPLFTKYNFVLDITKSEDQILKDMHPKTRYNIRLAERKGVWVEEKVDDQALSIYLKLYFETTQRQGYYGHNVDYHKKVWQVLKQAGMAKLIIAYYSPHNTAVTLPLVAWMLINFKDTLYYPYGGSSDAYKEVMASNLLAWEAIKLGKKLGLKKFDMWGALGPDVTSADPWYGFHRFKAGYGGKLVEYIGTYDLVFNYPLYYAFTAIDKLTSLKVLLLKWISH